jgi:spermidine synthase
MGIGFNNIDLASLKGSSPREPNGGSVPRLIQSLPALLFFFSGFASLVFETLCSRQLALVIGSTVQSASTTVAAFLFGLGLGAHFGGKLAKKNWHPIKLFAALEATAGLTAVGVLTLIPHLSLLLVPLVRVAPTLMPFVKVGLIFFILLLPSMAMGASLPVLAHYYVETLERAFVGSIGLLYGINTLGAAAGVLATDLFFVKTFGVTVTGWLSGILYLLVAGSAFGLNSVKVTASVRPSDVLQTPPTDSSNLMQAYVVLVVSGFCGLTFQVLWTRMLTFFHGNDVFSFSVTLSVYLLGLVIGASLMAWKGESLLGSNVVMGWLLVALGTLAYGSLFAVGFVRHAAQAMSALGPFFKTALSSGLLILPATICLGLLFPMTAESIRRSGRMTADAVSRAYILNTLGSVLGAMLAGFILLPFLGLQLSLGLTSALTTLVGGLLLIGRAPNRWLSVSVPALLLLSMTLTPKDLLLRTLYGEQFENVVYTVDDHYGSIAYLKSWNEVLQEYEEELRVDGFNMAGNSVIARRYTTGLAALPILLAEEPKQALIVCMGLGNTLNTALSFQETESVQCVELSPQVPKVLELTEHGPNVLHSPKLTTSFGDGRNFLLTTDQSFDVISAEPPPPTNAGIVNLYSREYYELCRRRLTKGGVVAQWLPVFQMSKFETQTMIKAFQDVFPNAYLWHTSGHQLCLIGSEAPLNLDYQRLKNRVERNQEFLSLSGWDNPALVAGSVLAGPESLRAYTAGVPALTDDWPVIQYSDRQFAIDRKFFFFSGAHREVHWKATPQQLKEIDRARRAFLAAYVYYDRAKGYTNVPILQRFEMGRFALETFPGDLYFETRIQVIPQQREKTLQQLKLDPNNPSLLYEAARQQFLLGHDEQALEFLARAQTVDSGQKEFYELFELLVRFRLGRSDFVSEKLRTKPYSLDREADYLRSLTGVEGRSSP